MTMEEKLKKYEVWALNEYSTNTKRDVNDIEIVIKKNNIIGCMDDVLANFKNTYKFITKSEEPDMSQVARVLGMIGTEKRKILKAQASLLAKSTFNEDEVLNVSCEKELVEANNIIVDNIAYLQKEIDAIYDTLAIIYDSLPSNKADEEKEEPKQKDISEMSFFEKLKILF